MAAQAIRIDTDSEDTLFELFNIRQKAVVVTDGDSYTEFWMFNQTLSEKITAFKTSGNHPILCENMLFALRLRKQYVLPSHVTDLLVEITLRLPKYPTLQQRHHCISELLSVSSSDSRITSFLTSLSASDVMIQIITAQLTENLLTEQESIHLSHTVVADARTLVSLASNLGLSAKKVTRSHPPQKPSQGYIRKQKFFANNLIADFAALF
jgi:hypothetical protein